MEQISKALNRLNLGVVKSTTEQGLSTEEAQLSEALHDKRIVAASDDELKPLMLYIYALVGLRGENYPKGLDKDFLHTYIREYYGGHTLKEVRLAFTMAIQHKLSVDATAFEFFNVAYFSKVMDAYRVWAKEAIIQQPAILPRPGIKAVEKHVIETEYCYMRLKEIDKLPMKVTV